MLLCPGYFEEQGFSSMVRLIRGYIVHFVSSCRIGGPQQLSSCLATHNARVPPAATTAFAKSTVQLNAWL